MSQSCSSLSEQNNPVTVPLSCVLFASVRIWSFGGNALGSGSARSLSSRCSSTRDENEDIEEGIVPVRFVAERSLQGARVRLRIDMIVEI